MNKTLTQSRIIATDSAQQFLRGQQVITPDIFTGIVPNTPPVNLFKIDEILNGVKKSIFPAGLSSIPNWNKSVNYLSGDCDIWLVTEQDVNSTVKVFNRFTRKEEDFVIPVPASKEDDIKDPEILQLLERLNEIKQECSQIVLLFLIGFLKYLLYGFRNEQIPVRLELRHFHFYLFKKFINILLNFLNKRELDTGSVERAINISAIFLKGGSLRSLSESEIVELLENLLSLYRKIEWRRREFKATCNNVPYDLIEIIEINPQNIERLNFLLEDSECLLFHFYIHELNEINRRLGEIMPVKSDWLAFYNGNTGAIFMLVDRIQKEYDQAAKGRYSIEFLYQEILLHELIHSCLDLYPRDVNGDRAKNISKWKDGGYSEESLDNAILLEVYNISFPRKHATWIKYLREIMSNQSFYYRNALNLEITHELDYFLKDLIKYKLKCQPPKATTPAPSATSLSISLVPGSYIVNGVPYSGIGKAAVAIFTAIVSSMDYSAVMTNPNLKKYLKSDAAFKTHKAAQKALGSKGRLRYYTKPLITKDGRHVYLWSQWVESHIPILQSLATLTP